MQGIQDVSPPMGCGPGRWASEEKMVGLGRGDSDWQALPLPLKDCNEVMGLRAVRGKVMSWESWPATQASSAS